MRARRKRLDLLRLPRGVLRERRETGVHNTPLFDQGKRPPHDRGRAEILI